MIIIKIKFEIILGTLVSFDAVIKYYYLWMETERDFIAKYYRYYKGR